MTIPERVKRFISATNSFCVIVEEGRPSYVVAPFEWAEHIFLGGDDEGDDEVLDEVNTTMSLLSDEHTSNDAETVSENAEEMTQREV